MPELILGDGLIFEESLPISFVPGPLPEPSWLARLNTDNHQLLAAESSLDEGRVPETLKDESPALVHELQRLEYKMNIVLRLVAELSARTSGLPKAQRIRMSARGLEWFTDVASANGLTGILSVYINPALPQSLKIPCEVAGRGMVDSVAMTQFRFKGLSDSVVELIEKLIFRHHRRRVAGARIAAA